MNGYLVVLRHSCDDLPLMLLDSHAEAVEAAKLVKPDDGENVKSLLSIDATTPICVWVYSFVGGLMTEAEKIQDFDSDDVRLVEGEGEGIPTGPMGP